jgi:hypothetical protein
VLVMQYIDEGMALHELITGEPQEQYDDAYQNNNEM